MELVILVCVTVSMIGLLAYARQVNRYGEKAAQRFRLPLFATIGLTVLVLSGLLTIQDLIPNLDTRGLGVVIILAMWIAVLFAMLMNSRAGSVLLSVGPACPIPWQGLGVFAVVNVALAFYGFPTVGAYMSLIMLTIIANWVFGSTLPVQITEKGFYGMGKIADWRAIRAYSWAKQVNGIAFLVLQLKGRWPIFATASIPIPSKDKDAVDQLLARQGAAQHGVPQRTGIIPCSRPPI